MEKDELERRIDAMTETALFLEDAPLATLDEQEWHTAFEALGRAYNRWLMRHEADEEPDLLEVDGEYDEVASCSTVPPIPGSGQ